MVAHVANVNIPLKEFHKHDTIRLDGASAMLIDYSSHGKFFPLQEIQSVIKKNTLLAFSNKKLSN